MNKIMQKSKIFVQRNSSTILTCISAAGVTATAVLAVIATPKAMKLIQTKEEQKKDKLTKMEIVKTAAPVYIPTALMGASTIACMFGANVLNKRKQAMLTSAYAFLDTSYKEYRKQVNAIYGEDADDKIKKGLAENRYRDSDLLLREEGKQQFVFLDTLQVFNSTLEDVRSAESYVNNLLQTRGYATLSEFNSALGLENTDTDFAVGWSLGAGYYLYGYNEIKFRCELTYSKDGDPFYILESLHEPTPDFEHFI